MPLMAQKRIVSDLSVRVDRPFMAASAKSI